MVSVLFRLIFLKMKGTINRITLKDFMCYNFLEVNVGKFVNLFLTPNGCGGSSFINGIILGLGGNPEDMGQGKTLSSFVKSGCELCEIHVELNDEKGKPVVITRRIHSNNTSFWLINERMVSSNDVMVLTMKLQILVENLCQVLLQDRVSDFSWLNPVNLLQSIQRSMLPCGVTHSHHKLKCLSERKDVLVSRLYEPKKKLCNLREENYALEKTVNILKEITALKKVQAWKLYHRHRAELGKVLGDRNQAQKMVQKLQSERQQNMDQVKKMGDKFDDCTQQIQQKGLQMRDAYEEVDSIIKQVEREQERIEQVREEYESKLHSDKNREEILAELRLQLTKLEADLFEVSQNSEEERKQRMEDFAQNLLQQRALLTSANLDESNMQSEINVLSRVIEGEEESLNSSKGMTPMQLSRSHPDTHKALMWLEQNRDKFKKHIYKPMVLELNLLKPSYATFVESAVPARDLLAFVAEDAHDMNIFLEEMQEKQKLCISVICSSPEDPHSSTYQPNPPLEQLKEYGFHMFVREMFLAPEPIMKYLCQFFKVHNIPVGTGKVDEEFMSIPLSKFFSEDSIYKVEFSSYTGEKITSVNSLSSANLLCMDNQVAEELRCSVSQLKEKRENLQSKLAEVKQRIPVIDQRIQELSSLRHGLMFAGEKKKFLESRIRAKRSQIENNENSKIDVLAEKRSFEEKFSTIMSGMVEASEQMSSRLQFSGELCVEIHRLQLVKQEAYKAQLEAEAKALDIGDRCTEQEETVANFEKQIPPLRQEVDGLLKKALELTNYLAPPESLFRDTLDEVAHKLCELEVKANRLDQGISNEQLRNSYEQNKLQIQDLAKNVEKLEKEMQNINKKIEKALKMWLTPLEDMVGVINKNYQRFFRMLGCCGEVLLSKPLDLSNYDGYGVVINVKFRDSQPLAPLDGHTQSEGELSVATVLYILALQHATLMPFRIVDVMNQDMDPANERKVFEILLKVAQQETATQYFLLYPKLPSNLDYPDNMNIVTISVVEGNVPDLKFCNVRKCLAQKEKAESNKK